MKTKDIINQLQAKCERKEAQLAKYKAALESIAHTRCAWQLSQEIAKAALAEGDGCK